MCAHAASRVARSWGDTCFASVLGLVRLRDTVPSVLRALHVPTPPQGAVPALTWHGGCPPARARDTGAAAGLSLGPGRPLLGPRLRPLRPPTPGRAGCPAGTWTLRCRVQLQPALPACSAQGAFNTWDCGLNNSSGGGKSRTRPADLASGQTRPADLASWLAVPTPHRSLLRACWAGDGERS